MFFIFDNVRLKGKLCELQKLVRDNGPTSSLLGNESYSKEAHANKLKWCFKTCNRTMSLNSSAIDVASVGIKIPCAETSQGSLRNCPELLGYNDGPTDMIPRRCVQWHCSHAKQQNVHENPKVHWQRDLGDGEEEKANMLGRGARGEGEAIGSTR